MSDARPLLRLAGLRVRFRTDAGLVRAVEDVGFEIGRGETLALVGESGCGKSVTALAILRLLPEPQAEVRAECLELDGEDLLAAGPERMRSVRGNEIAMIFQEPMTSLNPVYTIGNQIGEVLALHRGASARESRAETLRLLEQVGIPGPARRVDEYPHQLSGGMQQRVMIAMALACDPKVLIADEPTTALDVTIQAQILDLLRALQEELDMSILLITHDLGVVAELAHRVVVMYAGSAVERAPVGALFERPLHPYTAGLFHSLPQGEEAREALLPIEGNVPDPLALPPGCRFHPRCPHVMPRCRRDAPPLASRAGASRASACWLVDERPDVDLLARAEPPA